MLLSNNSSIQSIEEEKEAEEEAEAEDTQEANKEKVTPTVL